MRLTCNSCGSRFVIDDQLVRGKVVRLLCKHCSNVLEARLPSRQPPPLQLPPGGSPPRPPPPPGRKWYLALFGRILGPMGLAELRLRMRRGEVLPGDLVWHNGLSGWQPLSQIEELQQELSRRQPPEENPPPAPGVLPQQLGSGPIPLTPTLASAYPPQQNYPQLPGAAYALPPGYPPPENALPRSGEQPLPAFSLTPALGTPQLPYAWPSAAPPSRYAAWPLWLGILGGLMMLAATITLLLLHLDARSASTPPPVAPGQTQPPSAKTRAVRDRAPQVVEVPALEVRGARQRAASPAPPTEKLARARALARTAAGAASAPSAPETRLTEQQLYAACRPTLEACDRLALERGEQPASGEAVRFTLEVDAAGKRTLQVDGEGLTADLASCYRASAALWPLPPHSGSYRLAFVHRR